jgi:hypothetical protein
MGNTLSSRATARLRADRLAASNEGVITYAEAKACGLTAEEIRGNVQSGRWQRAVRGVFVDSGAPMTWRQSTVVACKAGPPGTVASHLTAAALFGVAEAPLLPHVTIPRATSGRQRLARVHRGTLVAADVTRVGRIPSTHPARTAVDLAALLGPGDALTEMVDALLARRLTKYAAVVDAVERAGIRPGRAGRVALIGVLGVWSGAAIPDSVPEARLARWVVQWGFPAPTLQCKVFAPDGTYLGAIDLGWPLYKVGLEYDGEEWHSPRRWESDEARERAITECGYTLLRADRYDLRPSSTRLRDELGRLLVPSR